MSSITAVQSSPETNDKFSAAYSLDILLVFTVNSSEHKILKPDFFKDSTTQRLKIQFTKRLREYENNHILLRSSADRVAMFLVFL